MVVHTKNSALAAAVRDQLGKVRTRIDHNLPLTAYRDRYGDDQPDLLAELLNDVDMLCMLVIEEVTKAARTSTPTQKPRPRGETPPCTEFRPRNEGDEGCGWCGMPEGKHASKREVAADLREELARGVSHLPQRTDDQITLYNLVRCIDDRLTLLEGEAFTEGT